ncbi:hypothetical protein FHL15_008327 [Xylaria flabelliformis]|uniref:Transcription factor CBF/NF-Y/archaeal histone domain-containing protein n=1 Tax=Xylaria flabelliformis TaxID=2512241 RepID=A0A553HS16_9PEZI|nr:hypothetical protein FHL15_008327 [Xylaria flabelliformis]
MSATGDNASYAPKSPDLSSFYSGPEVYSTPARLNHHAFPNSGTPTSGSPYRYPLQVPAQAQVPPQVLPEVQPQQVQPQVQQLEPGTHNFSQPQPHYQFQTPQHYNNNSSSSSSGSPARNGSTATTTAITNHNTYNLSPQQNPPFAVYNNDNNPQYAVPRPYGHRPGVQYYPQQQQQPHYPPSHTPGYHPQAPSYYASHTDSPTSTSYLPTHQSLSQHQHPQQPQSPLVFDQPTTADYHNATMPRGKAVAQAVKEPEVMDSPVRTKFPTARIKRIMQADEEVGKVAQQTPIAVGKALELFMVQLVHRSAEVAKEKNSKRITAPMLKQAIDSTNEWDFLRDIVAKVTEEKEGAKGSGRTKAESESDDDVDAGEVKKKGRGGRKKRVV